MRTICKSRCENRSEVGEVPKIVLFSIVGLMLLAGFLGCKGNNDTQPIADSPDISADCAAADRPYPDDGLAYFKRAEAAYDVLMNDLVMTELKDSRLERHIANLLQKMFNRLNYHATSIRLRFLDLYLI